MNSWLEGCKPDRTFLLDLDVAVSRARQLRRVRPVGQQDRMERLSDEFFEQVRRGYLKIARGGAGPGKNH